MFEKRDIALHRLKGTVTLSRLFWVGISGVDGLHQLCLPKTVWALKIGSQRSVLSSLCVFPLINFRKQEGLIWETWPVYMTSWSFVIYGISMVVRTIVITYCYTHRGKYTVSVVTKQLLFIKHLQFVFRHHPHIFRIHKFECDPCFFHHAP